MGLERLLKNRFTRNIGLAAGVTAGMLGFGARDATAQVAYDGHVSGVANVAGLEGSDWHTDLFVHYNANPGDANAVVRFHWAAKRQSPNPDSFVPMELQPGETVTWRDVIGTTFATEGSGALNYTVVIGDADRLTINAVTYNRVNERERYGAQVLGRSWSLAAPNGVPIIVPGPVDLTSYRANLAFTVDGENCEQVRVVSRNKSGNILHNQLYPVNPGSWNQIVDAIRKTNLTGQLPGVYWEIIGQAGCRVDGAVSLVNNPVNDGANIIGRTTLDTEEVRWLTGAAYLTGALGTNWRSNLQLINPGTTAGGSSFVYFPRGEDNGGDLNFIAFAMNSMQGRAIENILQNEFFLPNGSAGTFQTFSDPTTQNIAFMQTLNEVGVDDQGRTIAYGLNIPAVNWGAGAHDDLEGVITGIDHNDDNRANLLLQNTLYDTFTGEFLPMDVDVELITAAGILAHVEHYSLRPGEYLQEDKFVNKWLGAGVSLEGATMIVRGRPSGNSHAYGGVNAGVSVVNGNRIPDTGTGDGNFITHHNVEKVNDEPRVYEVCDTMFGYCYSDGDGNEQLPDDAPVAIPFNGWFGNGQPVQFEVKMEDANLDRIVTLEVDNIDEFPNGTISTSFEDGKHYVNIFQANLGDEMDYRNIHLRGRDHHGLLGVPMSFWVALEPQQ